MEGLNELMDKSVEQGVNFLRTNTEEVIIKLRRGAYNSASMENDAAKSLAIALNENIGHSGASFGFALRRIIEAAQKQGYFVEESIVGEDKVISLKK